MVEYSVDTSDVIQGLSELQPNIKSAAVRSMTETAAQAVGIARRQHRYRSRSGRLTSAIQYASTPDGVRLYINDAVAVYGKYVHDGTRYIDPDPFLENAVDQAFRDIETEVENAVADAARGAGFVVH